MLAHNLTESLATCAQMAAERYLSDRAVTFGVIVLGAYHAPYYIHADGDRVIVQVDLSGDIVIRSLVGLETYTYETGVY